MKGPENRAHSCCGAEAGIRTPTGLLPPAPQAGASASSATSASGSLPAREVANLATTRTVGDYQPSLCEASRADNRLSRRCMRTLLQTLRGRRAAFLKHLVRLIL